MMERQQVTIHYRRLDDITHSFAGQTLEQAVRAGMSAKVIDGPVSGHWKRRAWTAAAGGPETLLMNIFSDGGGHFFGDLTQYTTGFMQALLALEDKPMLLVEQQPPAAGKEYVHSMAWWLIKDNHAFILQSRAITSKQLEEYLTWLLKDRTAVVGPLTNIVLQAKFDVSEVGGDLDDISEIVVGGLATEAAARPTSVKTKQAAEGTETVEDVEAYQEVERRKSWRDRAMGVLRAVFSNEADLQAFMNTIPGDAELEVSVHIGYKTSKRRVTKAPMQQALRNLPDGEVKARGKFGDLSKNDIRLSYPARIVKINSLLEPKDVERALLEAYENFVSNGKIEP